MIIGAFRVDEFVRLPTALSMPSGGFPPTITSDLAQIYTSGSIAGPGSAMNTRFS